MANDCPLGVGLTTHFCCESEAFGVGVCFLE